MAFGIFASVAVLSFAAQFLEVTPKQYGKLSEIQETVKDVTTLKEEYSKSLPSQFTKLETFADDVRLFATEYRDWEESAVEYAHKYLNDRFDDIKSIVEVYQEREKLLVEAKDWENKPDATQEEKEKGAKEANDKAAEKGKEVDELLKEFDKDLGFNEKMLIEFRRRRKPGEVDNRGGGGGGGNRRVDVQACRKRKLEEQKERRAKEDKRRQAEDSRRKIEDAENRRRDEEDRRRLQEDAQRAMEDFQNRRMDMMVKRKQACDKRRQQQEREDANRRKQEEANRAADDERRISQWEREEQQNIEKDSKDENIIVRFVNRINRSKADIVKYQAIEGGSQRIKDWLKQRIETIQQDVLKTQAFLKAQLGGRR